MVDKEKQDAKRFSTSTFADHDVADLQWSPKRPRREAPWKSSCKPPKMLVQKPCVSCLTCINRECTLRSVANGRIQDLEREREQIMDVFEDQLNVALESVPEADDRSPTPSESILESPKPPPRSPLRTKTAPSRSRPTTRDSQMSSLSKLTSTTQPLSMMGAMRHAADKHRPDNASIMSNDSGAYERSDYVARRIAAIQAKVSYRGRQG